MRWNRPRFDGPIKSQPKINSFTFMGLTQQNQMEKPCQIKSIPLSSFRAAKPEKKQNQHAPAPVRYTYKYREIPLQRYSNTMYMMYISVEICLEIWVLISHTRSLMKRLKNCKRGEGAFVFFCSFPTSTSSQILMKKCDFFCEDKAECICLKV